MFKFSEPIYVRPGFLKRLFGAKDRTKEIRELLIALNSDSPGYSSVSSVIQRIIELNKKFPKDDFRLQFEHWLQEYVKHALDDSRYTSDEAANVRCLAAVFGFSDPEARTIVEKMAGERLADLVKDAITDGVVSQDESSNLSRFVQEVGLPAAIENSVKLTVVKPFLEREFSRRIEDRLLSPEEEEEMAVLSSRLGCEIATDEVTRVNLERMKYLWRIKNLPLSEISCDLSLQRGEKCLWTNECELHEMRRVTVRRSYSGPAFRVKIVKGVYWKSGSYRVARETADSLSPIDRGTLAITNKRIIFNGTMKNTTIRLQKVLDVEAFADGIRIDKETGKDPYFIYHGGGEVAAAIIARAVQDIE